MRIEFNIVAFSSPPLFVYIDLLGGQQSTQVLNYWYWPSGAASRLVRYPSLRSVAPRPSLSPASTHRFDRFVYSRSGSDPSLLMNLGSGPMPPSNPPSGEMFPCRPGGIFLPPGSIEKLEEVCVIPSNDHEHPGRSGNDIFKGNNFPIYFYQSEIGSKARVVANIGGLAPSQLSAALRQLISALLHK